jgi:hypothetical protein
MAFANIKGVARDPKDYEVYQETLYTDDDEKRMDVIGQNGNEGLHYEMGGEIVKQKEDIIMSPMPTLPPQLLPVDIKIPDEVLQGNLVKDIPKEEKPTNTNSWGSPGGSR